MDFDQKRKLKKFLYSRPMLVILFILLLLLTKGTWNVYRKLHISQSNLDMVHRELEKLGEREQALAAEIKFLQTDTGIEAEIRDRYRVVKDGEEIAIIVNDEVETSTTTSKKRGIWSKVRGIFSRDE